MKHKERMEEEKKRDRAGSLKDREKMWGDMKGSDNRKNLQQRKRML